MLEAHYISVFPRVHTEFWNAVKHLIFYYLQSLEANDNKQKFDYSVLAYAKITSYINISVSFRIWDIYVSEGRKPLE